MRTDRTILGLRLSSDIPLPELPPWTGPEDGPADIAVRFARVGAVTVRRPGTETDAIAADGTVSIVADGIAAFHVRQGTDILVESGLPAEAPILRSYILGSALTVLCHQRGIVPLHAGALAAAQGVVLLVGDSGAGKSTLSAALLAEGMGLLAEDLAPLRWSAADKAPTVLPSVPRLKLSAQTLRRFGHAPEHLPEVPDSGGKRALCVQPAPAGDVIAVCHLHRSEEAERRPYLEPMDTVAALASLQRNTLQWPSALAMGRGPAIFQRLAGLAGQVTHVRLYRTQGLDRLAETAALVVASMRERR